MINFLRILDSDYGQELESYRYRFNFLRKDPPGRI